jgi:hypothetical protein
VQIAHDERGSLPDNSGMSKHPPKTRWTVVPRPAPAGGAIVKRYSLVPVAADTCPPALTAAPSPASS